MAQETATPILHPITLTFHLSCWQNRRARIYIDGMTLDQFSNTLDVAALSKHLVLSAKDIVPQQIGELNGRASSFFHHSTLNSRSNPLNEFFNSLLRRNSILEANQASLRGKRVTRGSGDVRFSLGASSMAPSSSLASFVICYCDPGFAPWLFQAADSSRLATSWHPTN